MLAEEQLIRLAFDLRFASARLMLPAASSKQVAFALVRPKEVSFLHASKRTQEGQLCNKNARQSFSNCNLINAEGWVSG
jgi:hypothetical protein